MSLAFVLDTTAAVAYGKGSINVGEPLAYLGDEPGRTFAVPVVCLADAASHTDDLPMVILLGHHPLGNVTAVPADEWRKLVTMSQLMGGVGFAVPFLAAEAHDAYLFTAVPERYPDSDRVIDIRD